MYLFIYLFISYLVIHSLYIFIIIYIFFVYYLYLYFLFILIFIYLLVCYLFIYLFISPEIMSSCSSPSPDATSTGDWSLWEIPVLLGDRVNSHVGGIKDMTYSLTDQLGGGVGSPTYPNLTHPHTHASPRSPESRVTCLPSGIQ